MAHSRRRPGATGIGGESGSSTGLLRGRYARQEHLLQPLVCPGPDWLGFIGGTADADPAAAPGVRRPRDPRGNPEGSPQKGAGHKKSPASREAGLFRPNRRIAGLLAHGHLAVSGFSALIVPSVPMQTAPLAVPGSPRPSPVSEDTVATILSAEGLDAACLTYPGHLDAEVDVSVGARIVVLDPESQSIVPPVASAVAVNATELPPVLPPLHPADRDGARGVPGDRGAGDGAGRPRDLHGLQQRD